MAEFYVDGQQIIDQNAIHENLLNDSVGPFAPNFKLNINYNIFDKSTANLVEGQNYCISCKSTGDVYNKSFDGNATTNNFQFYLYTLDHSNYFPIFGHKEGNSIAFKMNNKTGTWLLCLQYHGQPKELEDTYPRIERVKIERGSIATAWVPSSQDLANAISHSSGE